MVVGGGGGGGGNDVWSREGAVLCSQADLNKSLKMVPKALEPYVLGESVRGWEDGAWGGGGGGGMTFGLVKGQCCVHKLISTNLSRWYLKLSNPMFQVSSQGVEGL